MNTSSTVQHAAVTAVLASVAVLAAAPAYAGPFPVDGTVGPRSPRVAEREATRDLHATTPPSATPAPTAQTPTGTPGRSDPSSVTVTVFALLGGSLLVGAAGFTVYRFRHHAPTGAATAA